MSELQSISSGFTLSNVKFLGPDGSDQTKDVRDLGCEFECQYTYGHPKGADGKYCKKKEWWYINDKESPNAVFRISNIISVFSTVTIPAIHPQSCDKKYDDSVVANCTISITDDKFVLTITDPSYKNYQVTATIQLDS